MLVVGVGTAFLVFPCEYFVSPFSPYAAVCAVPVCIMPSNGTHHCMPETSTFECLLCGVGQGIGPILNGEYGSASFTACFESTVALSLIFVLFLCTVVRVRCGSNNWKGDQKDGRLVDFSFGTFWHSPFATNQTDDFQYAALEGNAADGHTLVPEVDHPLPVGDPHSHSMQNFAAKESKSVDDFFVSEQEKCRSRRGSSAAATPPSPADGAGHLGPMKRGSGKHLESLKWALEKDMKRLEGTLVPRWITLNAVLMFLGSGFVAIAPFADGVHDSRDGPTIGMGEARNTIFTVANTSLSVAWALVAVSLVRNRWANVTLHWKPSTCAGILSFLHLFHTYNFLTPYIVDEKVPVPLSSAKALANLALALLSVSQLVLLATNYWRRSSAKLYLLTAESEAMMELEETRKNGAKAWNRLLSLCKVDYIYFITGCFGGLLATVANIGWQVSFGKLMQGAISQEKSKFLAAVHLQILSCSALYAGNALQLCFVEAAGMRLVTRIQRFTFMAMMEQDMSFYDENKSGELTTMLTMNTGLIRQGMTTQLAQAFRGLFQFFIVLVYLLINDLQLTGIFLGSAMVPLVVLGMTLGIISNISKKSAEVSNVQGGLAQEFLAGIRTVVSFAMQDEMKEKYDVAAWISNKVGVRLVVVQGLAFSLVLGGFYGALTIALWHGGLDLVDHFHDPSTVAKSATDLIVFMNMAIAMVMGLGWIMGGLPEMAKAVGASEKIFEILDRQALVNYDGGQALKVVKGNIDFEGIKFVYPTRKDKVVLENFSMSVKEGSTVALVGGSGSGKSTVLAMIERFYDPLEGSVRLDGVDIRLLDPMWMRAQIGFVMQEPTLFAGTVAENIKFGCEWVTEADVILAAKKANCHDFVSSLPQGYQTVVGEQGTSLSGGQKQRVAIARAILKDPKILLLDEATSALDAESEALVQDALDTLMRGRTTVIVAHRLSTIRNADTIFVFNDGVVAEQGSHEELLTIEGGMYSNLIAKQRGKSE